MKTMTIPEGQTLLRENFNEGMDCPCCGQLVKNYKRKLYGSIAAWLIMLVRRYRVDERFYSTSERWSLLTNSGRGDAAKLAYWGLIAEQPKDPDDTSKRTSGMWKPTEKGLQFVDGLVTVPSHVHVFDAKIMGFSETHTTIIEALGKRFDFEELMSGA